MSYINIRCVLLVLLFLQGCASTPNNPATGQVEEAGASADTTAELSQYQDAITYLHYGELEKAERILQDFTKKHPDLAGPWANLGLIEYKRDHPAEAEQKLNTALEKNPGLAPAENLLGLIEQKRGNISQAKERYSKALENRDDYAIAHYNLALLYDIYLQDLNQAVLHYQKYLELTDYQDQQTADWLEELKLILGQQDQKP